MVYSPLKMDNITSNNMKCIGIGVNIRFISTWHIACKLFKQMVCGLTFTIIFINVMRSKLEWYILCSGNFLLNVCTNSFLFNKWNAVLLRSRKQIHFDVNFWLNRRKTYKFKLESKPKRMNLFNYWFTLCNICIFSSH